jgi:hypothetical protein
MKTQPKTNGGKREGSGRKPLNGVGTVNTTVRLTPEQQLHFATLGGSAWLRLLLDEKIKSNR